MKRTLIMIALLFVIACTPAETAPVKIGFIGALTGTASSYGVPELNAAKLAIDEINTAGGINGRQIELIVEDGKCDGAASTTAATKLIEVDQVKFILGGHCSTETMSILPITEANKVFILAGATGTSKFTGAGNFSFRTFPSAKFLSGKLAETAFAKGNRTIVTFAAQTEWSQSVVGEFAKKFTELGGKIIGGETFAPGSTDFNTQLLKIKELSPDGIMISVQGPDSAALIIKQMAELGMKQQIFGDAVVVSPSTFNKTNGLLPSTALGALPIANVEKSKQLLEKYTAKFGELGTNPFYVTEGFDDAKIVAELIRACGDDTTCARQLILSKSWDGATGTFTFTPDGEPTPFVGIVRIEQGKMVVE